MLIVKFPAVVFSEASVARKYNTAETYNKQTSEWICEIIIYGQALFLMLLFSPNQLMVGWEKASTRPEEYLEGGKRYYSSTPTSEREKQHLLDK